MAQVESLPSPAQSQRQPRAQLHDKAPRPFMTFYPWAKRLAWINVIKEKHLKCRFSLHSPRVRDSSCSPEGVATGTQASGCQGPAAGGGSPGAGNLSVSCWAPGAPSLVAPHPDSRAHHTRASLPERNLGRPCCPASPEDPLPTQRPQDPTCQPPLHQARPSRGGSLLPLLPHKPRESLIKARPKSVGAGSCALQPHNCRMPRSALLLISSDAGGR